jgi:diguanylate cyclase (GGDEF)-like protein
VVDVKKRKRRDISSDAISSNANVLDMNEPTSDLEIYSKEVLNTLIEENLPPTPNNFSLYFDRLLEDKNENLRKQILAMLELEDNNDDENTVMLEQSLKQGFSSVKSILDVTAILFKNMNLMSKILEKRKNELMASSDKQIAMKTAKALEDDIQKLNDIIKKQTTQIKSHYEDTAGIFKKVEGETIFDNKYGVYNKRYLIDKIKSEQKLIKEFKHKSSLIMIELDRNLVADVNNQKATILMIRTVARLLLKTSRRSDIVSHYGNGVFAMLLKHTDLENAIKTSQRIIDMVSSSNFFLADKEVRLKVAIGITEVDTDSTSEQIIVSSIDGIEKAYKSEETSYSISLRNEQISEL